MSDNIKGYNLEDLTDIESMLLKTISNKVLNMVNLPFLAKVTAVNENKVDVELLKTFIFNGEELPKQQVTDLLVGFPYTQAWHISMSVDVGDIGLCIICDNDISSYKENGQGGVPVTQRRYNKVDSIFIPLSMYLQSKFEKNITLTNNDKTTSIILSNDGIVIKSNATVSVEAETIELGKNASNFVVNDNIATWLNTHVHKCSAPGVDSAPPTVPALPIQFTNPNIKVLG